MLWCTSDQLLGRAHTRFCAVAEVGGRYPAQLVCSSAGLCKLYFILLLRPHLGKHRYQAGSPRNSPQLHLLLSGSRVLMGRLYLMDGCKYVCDTIIFWYIWSFMISLLLVSIAEYTPCGRDSPHMFISTNVQGMMWACVPQSLSTPSENFPPTQSKEVWWPLVVSRVTQVREPKFQGRDIFSTLFSVGMFFSPYMKS